MTGVVLPDQLRAAHAARRAKQAKLGEFDFKEYQSAVKSAASLVMNSGLLSTLAFLVSRSEAGKKQAAADIVDWLGNWRRDILPTQKVEVVKFLEELSQVTSEKYLEISDEAMAYLRWLRQMVSVMG